MGSHTGEKKELTLKFILGDLKHFFSIKGGGHCKLLQLIIEKLCGIGWGWVAGSGPLIENSMNLSFFFINHIKQA